MSLRPPQVPFRLLAWALRNDESGPAILGDLQEAFTEIADRSGVRRARVWYTREAFWLAATISARSMLVFVTTIARPGKRNGPMDHPSNLRAIFHDAENAFRVVRRDLAFFIFAALIIGIGVGASTSIYSIVRPLLLQPLPFEQSERLVWIANGGDGASSSGTSTPGSAPLLLRDFRNLSRSFEGITGYNADFDILSHTLAGSGGEPERLVGVGVAQDFLDVLGVQPALGRNFLEEEGVFGTSKTVILSHGFWTRRFGADSNIIGTSVSIDSEFVDVVGVLPPSFDFSSIFTPHTRVDYLEPFPIGEDLDYWGNSLALIGRLKPGVTAESAQAELGILGRQLMEDDPDRWEIEDAVVHGLQQQIAGPFRGAMFLLAAAAGAVMLIVCTNLSNLLLARSPKRRRDMAIRTALGATRSRLLSQLLIESLTLSLGGALIGLLIALGATRAVAASSGISIPMLRPASIDGLTLLFTLGLATVAGVMVGIVPALQVSQGGEATLINDSGRGSSETKRSTWLREGLIVAEVALASILLVGGGLLLRSFQNVLDVELGFQAAETVAWRLAPSRLFESSFGKSAYFDEFVRSVEALPGVEAVGLTDALPLDRNRGLDFRAEDVLYPDGEVPFGNIRIIGPRYLRTMRIELLSGRNFRADDSQQTPRVIIINKTAAERLFPDQEPIGRSVLAGPRRFQWRVVGVVTDVRHQSLDQESGLEMYMPLTQFGWAALDMVVRSSFSAESLVPSVRAALQAIDPTIATGDFQTLDAIVDRAVSSRRFILLLLVTFAGSAVLLAALGIYGVLSYSVTQRIPEIGIRMALGESKSRVQRRVVGRTMALAGVGVVVGAVGAFAMSRLIGSLLYGVEPSDVPTFMAVATILLLVSSLAAYLPARRASNTDPLYALGR